MQKNVEQEMLQGMIEAVRKKLRTMWRNGSYLVGFCHAPSNKKEFSFSSSKMVEL